MENTSKRPKRKTAQRKIQRNDLSKTSNVKLNKNETTVSNDTDNTKKRGLHHKMNVRDKSPKTVIVLVVIIVLVIGGVLFGTSSLANVIKEKNAQNQVSSTLNEMVETELDQVRANYSSEPTNKPIQENDVVDIKYTISQNGSTATDESSTKLIINSKSGTPEQFIKALMGKNINDKVSVDMPSSSGEDGTDTYEFKIVGVYKLAELNDKLVKDFVENAQKNLSDDQKKELEGIKTAADLRKFFEKMVAEYLNSYQQQQQEVPQ